MGCSGQIQWDNRDNHVALRRIEKQLTDIASVLDPPSTSDFSAEVLLDGHALRILVSAVDADEARNQIVRLLDDMESDGTLTVADTTINGPAVRS